MWSGPRNLSTALMRSFGNRSDVIKVYDEPFYASYLKSTNKKHPMFEKVLNSQENSLKLVPTKLVKVFVIKNIWFIIYYPLLAKNGFYLAKIVF